MITAWVQLRRGRLRVQLGVMGEPSKLKRGDSPFYHPDSRFLADGLLTNFHLPRSTLLMLVCAFAGREVILTAYKQAIDAKYRFYSYGDCMLIL